MTFTISYFILCILFILEGFSLEWTTRDNCVYANTCLRNCTQELVGGGWGMATITLEDGNTTQVVEERCTKVFSNGLNVTEMGLNSTLLFLDGGCSRHSSDWAGDCANSPNRYLVDASFPTVTVNCENADACLGSVVDFTTGCVWTTCSTTCRKTLKDRLPPTYDNSFTASVADSQKPLNADGSIYTAFQCTDLDDASLVTTWTYGTTSLDELQELCRRCKYEVNEVEFCTGGNCVDQVCYWSHTHWNTSRQFRTSMESCPSTCEEDFLEAFPATTGINCTHPAVGDKRECSWGDCQCHWEPCQTDCTQRYWARDGSDVNPGCTAHGTFRNCTEISADDRGDCIDRVCSYGECKDCNEEGVTNCLAPYDFHDHTCKQRYVENLPVYFRTHRYEHLQVYVQRVIAENHTYTFPTAQEDFLNITYNVTFNNWTNITNTSHGVIYEGFSNYTVTLMENSTRPVYTTIVNYTLSTTEVYITPISNSTPMFQPVINLSEPMMRVPLCDPVDDAGTECWILLEIDLDAITNTTQYGYAPMNNATLQSINVTLREQGRSDWSKCIDALVETQRDCTGNTCYDQTTNFGTCQDYCHEECVELTPSRIGIDDSTGLQMKGTDRKCGQATLYNIGDFRKCSGGYCIDQVCVWTSCSVDCQHSYTVMSGVGTTGEDFNVKEGGRLCGDRINTTENFRFWPPGIDLPNGDVPEGTARVCTGDNCYDQVCEYEICRYDCKKMLMQTYPPRFEASQATRYCNDTSRDGLSAPKDTSPTAGPLGSQGLGYEADCVDGLCDYNQVCEWSTCNISCLHFYNETEAPRNNGNYCSTPAFGDIRECIFLQGECDNTEKIEEEDYIQMYIFITAAVIVGLPVLFIICAAIFDRGLCDPKGEQKRRRERRKAVRRETAKLKLDSEEGRSSSKRRPDRGP